MDQYLSTKKAAEFCGYTHLYFGRMMELYKIPRYGPKRNRFKVSDLEDWMNKPMPFIITEENEHCLPRYFRRVK